MAISPLYWFQRCLFPLFLFEGTVACTKRSLAGDANVKQENSNCTHYCKNLTQEIVGKAEFYTSVECRLPSVPQSKSVERRTSSHAFRRGIAALFMSRMWTAFFKVVSRSQFYSFFYSFSFFPIAEGEVKLKIYSDDHSLPYKTTKLKALYTKGEIDGLFAKWGVKDVYWRWDPEGHDVYAMFKIKEEVDGVPVNVSARVDCPVIWNHKTRAKAEDVNWNISLRVMYWYVKSHLEAAYLLQSSKAAAFLQDLAGKDDRRTLKDLIIPHIGDIQKMAALPKMPVIVDQEKESF